MNKYDNEYLETKKEIDNVFLMIFSNGVIASLIVSAILLFALDFTFKAVFIIMMSSFSFFYILYKVCEIANLYMYYKRLKKEK